MRIVVNTLNNKLLQMELPFQSFLNGTLASHLVGENLEPREALYEQLPATKVMQVMEDTQLACTLESACLAASQCNCTGKHVDYLTPVKIRVNTQDVAEFKQLFFPLNGMKICGAPEAPRSA